MTVQLFEAELGVTVPTAGYPFPATAQLALEYVDRGHHVTAVTTGTDIVTPIRLRSDRLDLVVLPARGRGRSRAFDLFSRERRAIRAALDAAAPDVVHAHWTYEFGLAARTARATSLVTVHDWAPVIARHNRHPYWYFRWLMQVICLCKRGPLSAPSDYLARQVRRVYRQSCAVIPNGIELAPFLDVITEPDAPPIVGMLNVGFTDRKNVATALRAWPLVRRAHPDALLALAGPDFEADGVAASWAARHGLTEGVRFDGQLPSGVVPSWMAGATLFLHTSREESFGIVLVEAMAAGRAVIVGKRSGAAADVVGPGGLPIDVDDVDQVATAVSGLLADPQQRADLGAAGRRIAQRYSLGTSADAYLALLHQIVDDAARRGRRAASGITQGRA